MKRIEFSTPHGWAHVEGGDEVVDDFVANELILNGNGQYSRRDVPKRSVTNGLATNDFQWAGGGGLGEEAPLLLPQLNYSGAAGAVKANEGEEQGVKDNADGPLLLPVLNFSPPEKARHNTNGRQGVLSPSTTGQRTSGIEEPLTIPQL